jgi:hypothetical protein
MARKDHCSGKIGGIPVFLKPAFLVSFKTNPVWCFRSDEQGNYSEYWPRVLGLLDQRLEAAFEEYSSRDRKGPLARMIAVTHYHTQAKLSEFKP